MEGSCQAEQALRGNKALITRQPFTEIQNNSRRLPTKRTSANPSTTINPGTQARRVHSRGVAGIPRSLTYKHQTATLMNSPTPRPLTRNKHLTAIRRTGTALVPAFHNKHGQLQSGSSSTPHLINITTKSSKSDFALSTENPTGNLSDCPTLHEIHCLPGSSDHRHRSPSSVLL